MIEPFLYLVSSIAAALAGMSIVYRKRKRQLSSPEGRETIFLFSSGRLADGSADAHALLKTAPPGSSDLFRVQNALAPDYRGLASLFEDEAMHHGVITSNDKSNDLCLERVGMDVRLTIRPRAREATAALPQTHIHAMQAELDLLRTNTNIAPFLAWRQNSDNVITWVNTAFLKAAETTFGSERVTKWPLPSLFSDLNGRQLSDDSGTPQRIKMMSAIPGDEKWFDCTAETVGAETLFTAVDVTGTVVAERRLREFMQTLTETFAQLPIGLAIFDRKRRLVLFNPSLVDLTSLKTDILAARPSLSSFLDALREQRMMPEPRDYKSWRASLTELELAAEQGTYEEIWSLSEGQTYRVTGRPHPDGAIALLFEDISSEISLTRRFRSELTLSQSVLDNLDEAVAVFSQNGVLSMVNAAYAGLWGSAPDAKVVDVTVADATRDWSEKCAPTPIWGDLRDYVQDTGQREDWQGQVQMANGRSLSCRFSPIAGGATLATFVVEPAASPANEAPASNIRNVG